MTMTPKEILKCMIVDDEPLALRLLSGFVNRTPFLKVHSTFLDPREALIALDSKDCDADIIFLDINMPEISGLDLARFVQPPKLVVFTTAFRDYAFESYAVHAFDYLLKPIDYPRFLATSQRALESFQTQESTSAPSATIESEQDYMFVKCDYKMVRVDFKSILYIKGLRDYVCVHTIDRPTSLIALTTMKAIEDKLPTKDFCRVHKSYIVNMRKIDAVERSRIYIGNNEIPVSDAYRENFFSRM